MADDNVVPYVIPLTSQKPKLLSLVPTEPGSRYKTRQLQVQVVGKSKMMKTVLVNILDAAKDMQIPPPYLGTFMGYEIGAQAKWDPKKPERQQAFLSGEHNTKDLSRICLQFIKEVVLCPNCGLPEIVIEISSESKVTGRCRACGGNAELRISNEKFKRYILNHPPTTKGGSFSGSKNVEKKEASVKKSVTKQNEREKAEQAAKEENGNQNKPRRERGEKDEEEIVWFSDTSDEAARIRRERMLPESMTKAKKPLPAVSELQEVIDSCDKLQELKSNCGATDAEFIPTLFDAIVGESTNLTPVSKKKDILKKFLDGAEAQVALLQCVEKFCGEKHTTLLAKVSHIIKELYDAELLEEESVFAWYDANGGNTKVRDQAAPIVKWFREAEEESGEEGEEEAD
jgi:translation initiation factor 5